MAFQVVHIDETDSTNRWLKEHGGGEDMVVVAEYQTAGRGCGTNTWESERGRNLLFSVLLHPTGIPARDQFRITQMASVALCHVLEQYVSEVSIKWPNDIYVGDRKICGMLIENTLQGNVIRDCVIGIGLNVNQWEFHSDAPNPVSLCQIVGHEVEREDLLRDFLGRIERVAQREALCYEYESRLFLRRKLVEYADKTGRFRAALQRVMPDGRLVLRDDGGCDRLYAFKEVRFIME